MKISFHNPIHQYFIGLVINLSFALILYSCNKSYENVQIPSGEYAHNIWNESDVMSYVNPGTNYVRYGVFGEKHQPDHFRTVGYPSVISFFYWIFGKHWLLSLQLFQCVLFAFIYPIITLIAMELYPNISKNLISFIFLFIIFSGTYFSRSLMILTDTFFALFFNLGMYLGLRTFKEEKKLFLFGYVICITIAGLIRPMAFLFPIVNIAIAYFISVKNRIEFKQIFKKTTLTTLILLVTCNLATVRNYINYSFFSPSDVIGINAFNYMTRKVLVGAGKEREYELYSKQLENITDLSRKTAARKKIMLQTMFQYPGMTCKILIQNSINLFFDNNLVNNIANYFGYNWKVYNKGDASFTHGNPNRMCSTYPFKWSAFSYYLTYCMMFMYLVLWLLIVHLFYYCLKTKEYETGIFILSLFIILIVPGILTGNGGSRFRLPFESFFLIFSLSELNRISQQLKWREFFLAPYKFLIQFTRYRTSFPAKTNIAK